MRYVKFTIETSDYGIGIIPNIFKNKGWDSYIPTTAPAHDLLDHSTDESGEIWQELRAIGAYIFRQDFGTYRNYTPSKYTKVFYSGYEFGGESLQNILNDSEFASIPEPRKVKLSKENEKKFAEVWRGFRWGTIKAMRNGYLDSQTFEWYKENKSKILGWVKLGFYNANKRYKGEFGCLEYTGKKINEVIQKCVAENAHLADSGVEFSLGFDFYNCRVHIRNPYGW